MTRRRPNAPINDQKACKRRKQNSGTMEVAKQHIEEIRKNTFEIGVRKNPLRQMLREAVKNLSAALYSKDVHFLMELIQNAEDNEYPPGVDPTLEFLITSRDITATGAPATLLIFNNEKGFSKGNMESICSVGTSTKAGKRKSGYIGEKGIGFKSVFLLTAHPYIFSNGYQIRFSEAPCPQCDVAYIVPEWVEYPSVADIQQVYGCNRVLPTTTLILPLKGDKVKAVKEQLSSLHPELLLFLSKIKRLSVKEHSEDPKLNTIRAVSISTERDLKSKKDIDAESYTVHLMAEEEGSPGSEGECGYYMWRQKFRVKDENKVEKRKELEEWSITLAFPFGERLNRGMISPGIYAYLPTETVTNLPFIIQADFLLPSSRETILWDDIWNQGILDCIPAAFVNAFVSLVKTREDAPTSSLASMFAFLPVKDACHPKLDAIRNSIKERLLLENIIPSESHCLQNFFHKPQEVARLNQSFWKILLKAKQKGMKLHNLSSLGKHILHSSFDLDRYNDALSFLGVKRVDTEWYPKCIQSCNLVMGVGEEIYVELLQFLAQYWSSFATTNMRSIPLLKYVGDSRDVSLLSINEATQTSGLRLCRSQDAKHISWMIDWSKEFRSAAGLVFLPEKTQTAILGVKDVLTWLNDYVKVNTFRMDEFAKELHYSLVGNNCRMVFVFAHFLHHTSSNGFLDELQLRHLSDSMPLVNNFRGVSVRRKGVLVPANGSKWVNLIGGSNSWRDQDYVVLSDEYLHSARYAGYFTPEKKLMELLKRYAGASDIPDACPPDAAFPTVNGPLNKENVFLMLDWIKKIRYKGIRMPDNFLNCIKNGSWLRVTMSGHPVYKPPNQSFFSSSSWGSLLQNGSEMVDIPLVDQQFYNYKLNEYQEELKAIGVMFDYGQACKFIGNHLMALAACSNLTRTKVIALLKFIQYLREKMLSVDEIVNAIKNVRWVKTSCGERSPVETVLFDKSWTSASVFSQITFLDEEYYGCSIHEYKAELELLGITVGFKGKHQIVLNHLKSSVSWSTLMPANLIFALKCIKKCPHASEKLVTTMKDSACLRTSVGFKYPRECYLFDLKWGCILQIFEGFPYIDSSLYGDKIFKYKEALQKIGVVVDFDGATKAFSVEFKQLATIQQITADNILKFLSCYKKLKFTQFTLNADLSACIQDSKWLRTRLGDHRSPKDCILYDSDWHPISGITLLPFIDDRESCYGEGIHEFRDELKSMGVVTDFKEGLQFVFSHFFLPQNPSEITPACVLSLLECIKNFLKPLPKDFLNQIYQTKWLKTTNGYMSSIECMLFDPKKKSSLQRCDGPFIDEEYYGANILSYKSELAEIGVIIDLSSNVANSLLAYHSKSLHEFAKIERIYEFLSEADWKPEKGAPVQIWIPTSSDDGVWVAPEECVLHDDNHLFSSRLHVLDQKNYKPKLFTFFCKAFNVKSRPSTDDYCKLWMEWENSRRVISYDECCAFWVHVIRHWNKDTKKVFSESVSKIPADSCGSGDILLLNKQDIFLPNDLLLKDLFEMSSPYSFFVWCPARNHPSIPQALLFDTYSKVGVRKISDSVKISELSAVDHGELTEAELKDAFIVKGLVMIILGFLSDPSLNLDTKRRHEAVKKLLNVKVFVTPNPITRTYSLMMSSGSDVTASMRQMVRWERDTSEFFAQKLDRSGAGARKAVVEYAITFSQVVSEGLLWDKEDKIHPLSELIKFGFLMDFDEDAVTYFMKSKNLQIFPEDEEFISSAFPSLIQYRRRSGVNQRV
ncbi:uncharacterized protein LOC110739654 isoform X2 [Chenopodium quinoa]|uniref:uncharacterized protein LOC110739654 isoform X2 n=1 Tax=Chenopodium quinoa TaxID=63459 RepID=UPI000B7868A3|nr:uncharacterized protein LOC110739654 isoform X2 [Chenopodium quinoa]XP_021775797.1 uncharacterized protein LOC110739654 isoform X2 [Chenopodium quinoa]